jgi:hypothetical protein
LRAISDPRGTLSSMRRNSTPAGIGAGIDGVTLDRLAAEQTGVSAQNSWAPALPLSDPATSHTGPSLELISQFPPTEDKRLVQHPKKIFTLVVLLVFVAGLGSYIGKELGWFAFFRAPRSIQSPVFVAIALPVETEKTPVKTLPNEAEETAATVLENAQPSSQIQTVKPGARKPEPRKTRSVKATSRRRSAPSMSPEPTPQKPAEDEEILSPAALNQLRQALRAALAAKGLKASDLKSLPDVIEFYESWRSARKKNAKRVGRLHQELIAAIKNANISRSILQKRFKDVHASLVRAAESRLEKARVAHFEEAYLDLDGKVSVARDGAARQVLAVSVLRLDLQINRAIQAAER